MHKHAVNHLGARVEAGGVRLSFYLTTPVYSARYQEPPPVVRIYRKRVTDFVWGMDYEEHFDGIKPESAVLVFEGCIEPINKRKFEYLDKRVKTGGTYVYWVACAWGRQPTGPVAVRVRDPQVWWPQQEICARLNALAERHAGRVSLKPVGMTAGGLEIPALFVGNREKCVALIGAIHPGESGPELIIPAVERLIEEEPELLARTGLAVLPSVGIDERERLVQGCPWYLRTNARGVDINRNFAADWETVEYGYGYVSSDPDAATYRGPFPASEPETAAVVNFLSMIQPATVLSYHALACITGAFFLTAGAAAADPAYMARCRELTEIYTGAFYPPPEKRWNARLATGCAAGSLAAYIYRTLGVPAFDLECDGNPAGLPAHRDQTTPAMLEAYQQHHWRGITALLKAL